MGYFNRAQILLEMEESTFQDETITQNVTITWGKAEPQPGRKPDLKVDYTKVLANLNQAIMLQPEWGFAYFNRANLKIRLKDYRGALDDYSSAILHQPDLAEAYFNRGLTHIYLKEKSAGCEDLGKAGELGIEAAYKAIKRYCYK
jgi:tetratricopeptide (TPR) repeat protein